MKLHWVLGGGLLLLSCAGVAADDDGTLTLDVRVEGGQSWSTARDHGNARISEHYHVVMPLKSMGAAGINPLNPDYTAPTDDYERYVLFNGYPGCRGEVDIRIDNRLEGGYADVSGMIPVVETENAQYTGTDIEREAQCLRQQVVYDTKEQEVHTYGVPLQAARGVYVRTERGQERTRNDAAEVGGFVELQDWINGQLRRAAASGTLETTLPAPGRPLVGIATAGAAFDGSIKVVMSWTFEPN